MHYSLHRWDDALDYHFMGGIMHYSLYRWDDALDSFYN